jgi:hypothetical protein
VISIDLSLSLSLSLSPPAWLPRGEQLPLPHTPTIIVFPSPHVQSNGSADLGLEPLKLWAKINPSSFKLSVSGILLQHLIRVSFSFLVLGPRAHAKQVLYHWAT